jgi:sugar phosphate isomerase/epimerase
MKLGIFAKTFDGVTPLSVLSAAARAGYDAVQYNMACSGLSSLPTEINDEVAEAIRSASLGTGIEIAAISATYNMIHPDLSAREMGRRSFAAIAAVARRIGTRLVTVCTGSCDPDDQWRYHRANDSPAAWREMCREFALLLPLAEKYDIAIGVEPELANVVNSAQRASDLIAALGSDRIQIVLDPANLFVAEEPERRKAIIEIAVDLLHDRIALAHAKDRFLDGRFATAGKGVLDFSHFLTTLGRAGFQGTLVTHGLAASEAPEVAAFLRDKRKAAGALA